MHMPQVRPHLGFGAMGIGCTDALKPCFHRPALARSARAFDGARGNAAQARGLTPRLAAMRRGRPLHSRGQAC